MAEKEFFSEALSILLKNGELYKARKLCKNRLDYEPNDAKAYIGLLLIDEQVPDLESLKKLDRVNENKYYKLAYEYADDELKQQLVSVAGKPEIENPEINKESGKISLEALQGSSNKKPVKIKDYQIVIGFILLAGINIYVSTDIQALSKVFMHKQNKKKTVTTQTAKMPMAVVNDEGKYEAGKAPYVITFRDTADKIISECMVKCPAGTFMMGSPGNEVGRKENEFYHSVEIAKDFYISKYEVTQAQFQAIMYKNPSICSGKNNPVDSVKLSDIDLFCAKLNAITRTTLPDGYIFDIPTQAQWEYACRAGTTSSFNNGKLTTSNYKVTCENCEDVAWYMSNSDRKSHPVGQKKPNAWGIYDMHGNVREWCKDVDLNANFVTVGSKNGIKNNYIYSTWGGGFKDSPICCRSSYHETCEKNFSEDSVGFRFALVPNTRINLNPNLREKQKIKK